MQQSKRGNMQLRFSIKSMLIAVVVVAVLTSFSLYLTEDLRRRWAIHNDLMKMGATQAHVFRDRSISLFFLEPITEVGFERYPKYQIIEFQGFDIPRDTLLRLTKIQRIDAIMFQSCEIDLADLEVLNDGGRIDTLLFWNTQVSDEQVKHIASIEGLKSVDFSKSGLTQKGVEALQTLRPDLSIHRRP